MTTRACLIGMRWSLVVTLAACTRSTAPAPVIAAHHVGTSVAAARVTVWIDHDDLGMVALPDLPAKRGIDRIEESTCRAHLKHVQGLSRKLVSYEQREDDMNRLARAAMQVGGDCRIDTDEMFEANAPTRVGGCMGASVDEALLAWRRVAAVASSPARRAAALRNVATLAWRDAQREGVVDRWILAGDAHVSAAASDSNDLALSSLAVDAYENALRTPLVAKRTIDRAKVIEIAHKLERITDGSAADRARALRARLRW